MEYFWHTLLHFLASRYLSRMTSFSKKATALSRQVVVYLQAKVLSVESVNGDTR